MTPDCHAALLAHARECAPLECCGLIVRHPDGAEVYHPCRNLNTGLDRFRIAPESWAEAEDSGTVLAICHSHPDGNMVPSPWDVTACEAWGLPSMIIGPNGELHRLDPAGHRERLLGRAWSFGWNDCWTLVRDFYGANLPDFPRLEGQTTDLYMGNWERLGFKKVDEAQPGDAFLFRFGRRTHAAIYMGDGEIIHHPQHLNSVRELMSGVLFYSRTHILRRAA